MQGKLAHDPRAQALLLRTMLFIVIAASSIWFGIVYYQSHRQLDLKSISRDAGRYTYESELCGTEQTTAGTVHSVTDRSYDLWDETASMQVKYKGEAPMVGERLSIRGKVVCLLEAPASAKIRDVEIQESTRSSSK
jgi:hypothetical protein